MQKVFVASFVCCCLGFFGRQAVADSRTLTTHPWNNFFSKRLVTNVEEATLGKTPASSAAKVQGIVAVSVNSKWQTGDDNSLRVKISGDGRYVVFASDASDLVAGDTNGKTDVFIHDRNADSGNGIWRISVDKDNKGGNKHSGEPAISADGRYVVFSSAAKNLVEISGNSGNIFVYDLEATVANRIQLISVDKDKIKGGNGHSVEPAISADGRYVVFVSDASNLIDGDNNGKRDIFIYDRNADSGNGIQRISVDKDKISKGGNGASFDPAISADGRYVVFVSEARAEGVIILL